MNHDEALDFYKRLTEGTERYKEIELEHSSGHSLGGFRLHPIGKTALASVIQRMPDKMFENVDDVENAEEAEERLEEQGGDMSAVTEDTVEAFEDLAIESLDHDEFTSPQLRDIVEELNFEVLFEVGIEIIEMSVEETGQIKDFHEPE